jgi:RNA polymerase sigma-70 factor (ECF subfamily)
VADRSHSEEFVRLLTESQRRLYVYVLSLLGNSADADEVLQETNLVLWRKSHEFTPGSNFLAWACKTAYFEVLAFRKRRQQSQMRFDPEVVDMLADEAAVRIDSLESKRQALAACMAKLPHRDRQLLHLRYGLADVSEVGSIGELARRVGRTVRATYQALHRIRMSLLDCMRRRLAAEDR